MRVSNWTSRYMDLANMVAGWSRDPSTQVGAVIVGEDKAILSMGYNGFPRGMKDLPERYEDKDFKHRHILHAEENAILNATRNGTILRGATMYVTHPPCQHCASALVQSGIQSVYYEAPTPHFAEKYRLSDTVTQLKECGVALYEVNVLGVVLCKLS